MSLSDFDETVAEFMREFGTTAYVITHHSGSYNTSTSTFTQYTTNVAVKAIMMDRTLRSDGEQNNPNSLIQAGDKQVFVQPPEKADSNNPPLDIDTVSDMLLMGGVTYRIVTMKQINPTTSSNVMFELYVRK